MKKSAGKEEAVDKRSDVLRTSGVEARRRRPASSAGNIQVEELNQKRGRTRSR